MPPDEYDRPAPPSERLARLETRVDTLVRDHIRLEAHLDNQDHTLDTIRDTVGSLAHDKRVFSKVVHWVAALVAGAIGYLFHWIIPLPR